MLREFKNVEGIEVGYKYLHVLITNVVSKKIITKKLIICIYVSKTKRNPLNVHSALHM